MSWWDIVALVIVGLIGFAVLVQIVADAVVRSVLRVRRGEIELMSECGIVGKDDSDTGHSGCRCRRSEQDGGV